jgi:S1-C subfamily serine protease/DNA-directed RNA polymerase subunit RPC12/RpoP
MIRFACPQCHRFFQVEDEAADRRLNCPQCGVALVKAELPTRAFPLAGAVGAPGARGPNGPAKAQPLGLPGVPTSPFAPAPAAGGGWPSLSLPVCLGGGVLVGGAIVLMFWAAAHFSHLQTVASDHREDDAKQAAAQPAGSAGGTMATPAAASASPTGAAPVPGTAAPPAMVSTPAAPEGGMARAKPAAVAPQGGATAVTPVTPAPQDGVAGAKTIVVPPPGRPALVSGAAGPAEVVDLLRQVNPMRDSARGEWKFLGTYLMSPRNEMGVLRFPQVPPAEYRLMMVVERMTSLHPRIVRSSKPPKPSIRIRGLPIAAVPQPTPEPLPPPTPAESDERLDIVLCVDGHRVALVLDGFQRTISGLELIDGKGIEVNGTAFHGEVLPRLRNVIVVCTVMPGSVDATADGRTVVHWTGPSDALGLEAGLAEAVGKNSLALVSSAQFRVQRIELVPLDGTVLPGGLPGGDAAAAGPGLPAVADAVGAGPALSPEILRCVALVEHPLGSGSGFAVGNKLVVTNAHVVEGAFPDEIKVQFGTDNGKPQPIARILYFDRSRDLCILEVRSELAGLPVRGDYKFNPGDRVTLVGNPSAGSGILVRNAVNRGRLGSVVHIENQDFYQIEARVNPGWSGGPVLDADGKVIAVVAMKASDKAVTAIRSEMSKLDQDYRARIGRTAYNVGLTYGIPAGALGDILKDPALRDQQRQAQANDRRAARTLADRLSFLAELCMVRAQVNVSPQVRAEASNLASGKAPSGGRRGVAPRDAVALISEFDAARLGRLLEDEGVKSMESKFRDRLDARISAVQESEYLPDPVKHDLRTLAVKLREAAKFADHPPTTYAAFSTKFKGLSHDFKEKLKSLAENLKEKES